MRTYINDALEKYIEKNTYPWHMPGHKRQRTDDALWSGMYARDFTEAKDLDDMHEPEAFIADCLGELRRVYGTYRTYMLVNGSTSGIMTAVHAVCRRGDTVLVARNCHKSVYNAVCMLDLKPEYIVPDYVGQGILGDISCEALARQVDELAQRGVKPRAAVVTSPTYEGVISDIEGIAELLHSRGIYLIADEAQGAHLRFMGGHRTAMECGADIVIESLHKTMPALTPTSLIHVMAPELDAAVRRYLQIFQTSSPSYIFMQSIERAVAFGENEEQAFEEYKSNLAAFRNDCVGLKNIELLSPRGGRCRGVYDYDEGRLVFVIRPGACVSPGTPLTGVLLADMLADRYGLIVEMAAANYVICISSVMDSEESYGALHMAVKEIDGELIQTQKVTSRGTPGLQLPKQRLIPGKAWNAETVSVELAEAQGRIAGTFVYAYPPGIPVLVPGELIDGGMVSDIRRRLDSGLHMSGVADGRLSVLDE